MTDDLTPTPYDAGWRDGWADANDGNDRYGPPNAFASEYDQGYGDALDAWDIQHGAFMIPEEDMTGAQRESLARKRAVLGESWPWYGR